MTLKGEDELTAQKAYVAKITGLTSDALDELIKLVIAVMFTQTENGQTPLDPAQIKK